MSESLFFILGVSLIVVGFFLQVFPRFGYPEYGIDTWRWLLYAKKIYQNKFRLPKVVDHYIIPGAFSAPPLILVFLAFFSKGDAAKKYNFIFSPLFSLIENTLLFAFTYFVSQSLLVACVASAFYAFTPADVIENSNLNMRSLGKLTVMFTLAALILHHNTPTNLWFALAVTGATLTLLGHRMSTQFLFVCSLFFSVMWLSFVPVVVFALAFVLAFVLSGGQYLNVLKSHLSMFRFWFSKRHERFAHPLTGYEQPKSFFVILKTFLTRLVRRNPYLFSILPVFLTLQAWRWQGVTQDYLLLCGLALVLALSTTFITFILCFGEGYRYLEYLTFPVSFLTATWIVEFYSQYNQASFLHSLFVNTSLFLSVLASLVSILHWYKTFKTQAKQATVTFSQSEEAKEVLAVLKRHQNESKRFYSIPPIVDDYVAYHFENWKVGFHDNGQALVKSYPYYPVVRDTKRVIQELDLDFLLISCQLVPKGWFDDKADLKECLKVENKGFYLFEFKREPHV